MARAMKDSGIPWIGEIPDKWKLVRGKFLFRERIERGNKISLQLLTPSQKYGVVPQELYDELSGMKSVKLDESTDYNTLKSVYEGDFVISLRSFQGGFEYSKYDGVVSPAYHVFYRTSEIHNEYYRYMFKNSAFIEKMATLTKTFRDGKSIAYTDFADSIIPVPPIDEQQRIAAFIDTECARIDAIIEKTRASIEEYKKLKQAVITEAVTKGIRSGRKMKDSWIAWIGEIPEEWETYRIANLYDERNESGNDSLPILSISINTGISDREIPEEEQSRVFVRSEDKSKYIKVLPGDLAYNMMRAWQGAFGAVRVAGMVSPAYVVAKPKKADMLDSRYIEALLRTPMAIEEMHRYSKGITDFRLRLYWPEFKNIRICVPSIEEQEEIADYIDTRSGEYDALIEAKERVVDELEKYKKSVIYEYVTGKKEVL